MRPDNVLTEEQLECVPEYHMITTLSEGLVQTDTETDRHASEKDLQLMTLESGFQSVHELFSHDLTRTLVWLLQARLLPMQLGDN